jgi:hypothetical protein
VRTNDADCCLPVSNKCSSICTRTHIHLSRPQQMIIMSSVHAHQLDRSRSMPSHTHTHASDPSNQCNQQYNATHISSSATCAEPSRSISRCHIHCSQPLHLLHTATAAPQPQTRTTRTRHCQTKESVTPILMVSLTAKGISRGATHFNVHERSFASRCGRKNNRFCSCVRLRL